RRSDAGAGVAAGPGVRPAAGCCARPRPRRTAGSPARRAWLPGPAAAGWRPAPGPRTGSRARAAAARRWPAIPARRSHRLDGYRTSSLPPCSPVWTYLSRFTAAGRQPRRRSEEQRDRVVGEAASQRGGKHAVAIELQPAAFAGLLQCRGDVLAAHAGADLEVGQGKALVQAQGIEHVFERALDRKSVV